MKVGDRVVLKAAGLKFKRGVGVIMAVGVLSEGHMFRVAFLSQGGCLFFENQLEKVGDRNTVAQP